MRRPTNVFKTWLRCSRCNRRVVIQRSARKRKKKGHVKTMWCPWCKGVRQFIEKG